MIEMSEITSSNLDGDFSPEQMAERGHSPQGSGGVILLYHFVLFE